MSNKNPATTVNITDLVSKKALPNARLGEKDIWLLFEGDKLDNFTLYKDLVYLNLPDGLVLDVTPIVVCVQDYEIELCSADKIEVDSEGQIWVDANVVS